MLRSVPALVALAALALPAAAAASTAENGAMDGRMHVTAKPGEANVITITREDIALPARRLGHRRGDHDELHHEDRDVRAAARPARRSSASATGTTS
jgi:hypothetical protein